MVPHLLRVLPGPRRAPGRNGGGMVAQVSLRGWEPMICQGSLRACGHAGIPGPHGRERPRRDPVTTRLITFSPTLCDMIRDPRRDGPISRRLVGGRPWTGSGCLVFRSFTWSPPARPFDSWLCDYSAASRCGCSSMIGCRNSTNRTRLSMDSSVLASCQQYHPPPHSNFPVLKDGELLLVCQK